MSSHREAPEISKDPVADSTDVYAFVSPDKPDTVTLIANYIPLQGPAAGPNFYEFGDDVSYEIHIDNNGDGQPGGQRTVVHAHMGGAAVDVHLAAADVAHMHDDRLAVRHVVRHVLVGRAIGVRVLACREGRAGG